MFMKGVGVIHEDASDGENSHMADRLMGRDGFRIIMVLTEDHRQWMSELELQWYFGFGYYSRLASLFCSPVSGWFTCFLLDCPHSGLNESLSHLLISYNRCFDYNFPLHQNIYYRLPSKADSKSIFQLPISFTFSIFQLFSSKHYQEIRSHLGS